MYKLTELKRKAKGNMINKFYHDGKGFKNIIFSYENKIMVNITSFHHESNIDIKKLWDFFKKENHIDYDNESKIQVNPYYNSDNVNKFNKLIADNQKDFLLSDTGITYKQKNKFYKNEVTYKIYKKVHTDELYKIDASLLDFIDLSKVNLYVNHSSKNICYITNNTFDTLGICIMQPFDKCELLDLL